MGTVLLSFDLHPAVAALGSVKACSDRNPTNRTPGSLSKAPGVIVLAFGYPVPDRSDCRAIGVRIVAGAESRREAQHWLRRMLFALGQLQIDEVPAARGGDDDPVVEGLSLPEGKDDAPLDAQGLGSLKCNEVRGASCRTHQNAHIRLEKHALYVHLHPTHIF
jgi:hypothetical protein